MVRPLGSEGLGLESYRLALLLTRTALAKLAGVNRATISKVERGGLVDKETIQKIISGLIQQCIFRHDNQLKIELERLRADRLNKNTILENKFDIPHYLNTEKTEKFELKEIVRSTDELLSRDMIAKYSKDEVVHFIISMRDIISKMELYIERKRGK